MNIRFNLDPSGEPHIWNHHVSEREVHEALADPLESIQGREASIVAIGQTRGGRYLKVIYSPDLVGDGIFVITAFDASAKQIRALKKRIKRKYS